MTKGAALGMRSRVLLFAARPLFNGGGSIGYGRGMVNHEGKPIFPQGEDLNKWTKAAEAAKWLLIWMFTNSILTRRKQTLYLKR